MTLYAIVASVTTAAFVIPSVVLLTSPVMWYKEHHWNFSVLQRIHLSNFVMFMVLKL
jgi:hypothetical protein